MFFLFLWLLRGSLLKDEWDYYGLGYGGLLLLVRRGELLNEI